jgi:excinuclease ABC subunit B
VAEEIYEYSRMTPEQGMKKMRQLEQKMYKHAKDLEFEEAARIRDEITRLKDIIIGKPSAM